MDFGPTVLLKSNVIEDKDAMLSSTDFPFVNFIK
jgi:hypothetical protein